MFYKRKTISCALAVFVACSSFLTAGSFEKGIPIYPGTMFEAEYEALFASWCDVYMTGAFKKLSPKKKPWSKEALAFVEDGMAIWKKNTTGKLYPEKLIESGKRIVSLGCDDPLVLFLLGEMIYNNTEDWRPVWDIYENSVKRFVAVPYPRGVARRAALRCIGVANMRFMKANTAKRLAIEWTKEALTEESFKGKYETVFLREVLRESSAYFDYDYQPYKELFEGAPMADWIRFTLLGFIEEKSAHGEKVAPEEHFAAARRYLLKAYELNPSRPEAATLFIDLAPFESDTGEVTRREWFERAIKAQFDYFPAYKLMQRALHGPGKWHPDAELDSFDPLMEFARACLNTNRFDTQVPFAYFDVIADVSLHHSKNWRDIFLDPVVAKEILSGSVKLIEEPTRAEEREMRVSFLAVNAWMCGDYELAARVYEELGRKLHVKAEEKLMRFGVSPEVFARVFAAEVAILKSAAKEDYFAAEDAYYKKNIATAYELYGAALKKSEGAEARAHIQRQMDLIDVQDKLDTGEPVELKPGLTWLPKIGEWDLSSEAIYNQGDDNEGFILSLLEVGPDFELTGEVIFPPQTACCRNFGIVTGYHQYAPTKWTTYQIMNSPKTQYYGEVFNCFNRNGDGLRTYRLEFKNRFVFQSWKGKVSFYVNDYPVFVEKEHPTWGDEMQIGLGSERFCGANRTEFRNIRVRKLWEAPAKVQFVERAPIPAKGEKLVK